ncbi:ROK family protein [Nonomuraea jabiensis]|uniref:Putative NBD/HSP70 family sugar kinase n=1 Tax=Nonomuraea jabiensis TaxID=882448 RepID=A0A7W9G463_9ACTN|nr:ROK family protein [Nonomuraea jabiensis]MBB5776736.1 putative NBD/HSP70 family sugar kinase [Nonomuraea jabiensis]
MEAGYLYELPSGGRTGARLGRPVAPLAVRADREHFVGVKITETELIAVLTDLRAEVRSARHLPLATKDVPAVVEAVAQVVTDLAGGRERTHCLGISVAGDVDKASGLVRYNPFLEWRDVPLADLAASATGLTVTVENDVNALAVAEQWFGEGVGATTFAVVTVGAGIGCGLVVNGALVTGGYGVAGEIGHIPVSASGPACYCSGRGCLEAIASEPAIVRQARAVTGDAGLGLPGAVDLAHAGHPAVREVFAIAGRAMGRGLAALVNLVGPEKVVVTGEGLAAYDLFEEYIRETFNAQAYGAAGKCPLVIRPLPFEEWARGAAAVSLQSLFTSR